MPIPINGGGQNKVEVIAGYFYRLGSNISMRRFTVGPGRFRLLRGRFPGYTATSTL